LKTTATHTYQRILAILATIAALAVMLGAARWG
jgi:hypothetical protein